VPTENLKIGLNSIFLGPFGVVSRHTITGLTPRTRQQRREPSGWPIASRFARTTFWGATRIPSL